jgi:hypothetical protein
MNKRDCEKELGGVRSLPAVSGAAAAPAAFEVPSLRAAREWVPTTNNLLVDNLKVQDLHPALIQYIVHNVRIRPKLSSHLNV